MTEGVDDGFTHGGYRYFRHIHAVEAVEFHADVNVFENVFLRFFDKFQDVAGKVVAVNNSGAVR